MKRPLENQFFMLKGYRFQISLNNNNIPGHSYKDCPKRQPTTTLIVHRRGSLNKATNPTVQSNVSNDPTGNSVATIEHVDAAAHAQESNSGSQDRSPEDAQKSSHKDQGSENTDKTKATGHSMDLAIKEMEVTPTPALVGSKRGQNGDDSSDDGIVLPEKGKAVPDGNAALPLSNQFDALVDEAANLPLLPEDPDSPIVRRNEAPRSVEDYDGDNDSSADDVSVISDMKSDPSLDPDNVDELSSPVPAHDLTSKSAPLLPCTGEDSKASPSLDSFALALTSKCTRPAPVVGSAKRPQPKGDPCL